MLALVACSGPPAVSLEEPYAALEGEWFAFSQQGRTDSKRFTSDRRYLRIRGDGETVYARCYLQRDAGSSVRTSVEPAPGRLVQVGETGFRIRVAVPMIDVIGMDFDFVINRMPVDEQGRWVMQVDDALWVRRGEGEPDPLDGWNCPEL